MNTDKIFLSKAQSGTVGKNDEGIVVLLLSEKWYQKAIKRFSASSMVLTIRGHLLSKRYCFSSTLKSSVIMFSSRTVILFSFSYSNKCLNNIICFLSDPKNKGLRIISSLCMLLKRLFRSIPRPKVYAFISLNNFRNSNWGLF